MAGWFSAIRNKFRRRRRRGEVDDITDEWLSLLGRVDADREARTRALRGLEEVVSAVSERLYAADPVALAAVGAPSDEYEPEAETIVMRLADSRDVVAESDVLHVVHEEFVRWFDESLAGEPDKYRAVAREIHAVWQQYLLSGS